MSYRLQNVIRELILEKQARWGSVSTENLDYLLPDHSVDNKLPIYAGCIKKDNRGYAMQRDLYSKKLLHFPGQEDGLLYLTNKRTFKWELSKRFAHEMKQYSIMIHGQLHDKYFQIRESPPGFCKRYRTGILQIEDTTLKKATFKPQPCMSWTCPECAEYKALRVKYQLIDIIMMNKLNYFLTLTLDPRKIPKDYKDHTHKYITKLFNHFMSRLRLKTFRYYDKKKRKWFIFDLKKQEEKLKYVWICEFQKNGNAHLHILLNQFLPVEVLRQVWVHVGGGHIMYIEKVKSQSAISMYLTSYIVKGLKTNTQGKGFRYFERRYSVSHSCIRPKKTSEKLITADLADGNEILSALEKVGLGWIRPLLYNPSGDTYNIYFNHDPKDGG